MGKGGIVNEKENNRSFIICVLSVFSADLVLADELTNVFEIEEPECSITCSADTVIDSFLDDRNSCKKLYDGKRIKVTGQIFDEIEINEYNTYFSLDSSTRDVTMGVTCYFSNVDLAGFEELNVGDYVTVVGTANVGLFGFELSKCNFVKKVCKEEFDDIKSSGPLVIHIEFGSENPYSEPDETAVDILYNSITNERVYEYIYRIPVGDYNVKYVGYYNQDKCNFFIEEDTIVNEDGFYARPINQDVWVSKDSPVTVSVGENEVVYSPVGGNFIFEKIE